MNSMQSSVSGELYINQFWGGAFGGIEKRRSIENLIFLPKRKPRRSVLVVEDDKSASQMFDLALQSTGQFVALDWATNAEEAISFLKCKVNEGQHQAYDLVIIDIFLGGNQTGIDVWKYLFENGLHEVPVIMTSGLTEKRFIELMGPYSMMPSFLPKPFQINRCVNLIEEAMYVSTWN